MGLGLPTTSGDFNRTPIIKYDARAGRIHRIDRSNASGQWETNEVEITRDFQAIFDLENIETGWLNFPAGGAPDIRTVRIGNPMPDRPSDAHRSGFRVYMKLGKSCGGDVRELAANAKVSIAGMDALYDAYEAEKTNHPGQLPVVTLKDTVQVKSSGQGQTSTNYQPVWDIVKWVDRPAELPPTAVQPAEPKATATQAATAPAAQAPATPARELVNADDEF